MCMIKNPELVNGYLVSVSLAKRNEMEWSVETRKPKTSSPSDSDKTYYIIKYETGLSECKFSGKIDSLWATKYSLNACESKNINKIP